MTLYKKYFYRHVYNVGLIEQVHCSMYGIYIHVALIRKRHIILKSTL